MSKERDELNPCKHQRTIGKGGQEYNQCRHCGLYLEPEDFDECERFVVPKDKSADGLMEDARAFKNSAEYEFERYLNENGTALRIPKVIPGTVMIAAEKFAEQYARKRLESETPRITAEAVREFVERVRQFVLDHDAEVFMAVDIALDAVAKEMGVDLSTPSTRPADVSIKRENVDMEGKR